MQCPDAGARLTTSCLVMMGAWGAATSFQVHMQSQIDTLTALYFGANEGHLWGHVVRAADAPLCGVRQDQDTIYVTWSSGRCKKEGSPGSTSVARSVHVCSAPCATASMSVSRTAGHAGTESHVRGQGFKQLEGYNGGQHVASSQTRGRCRHCQRQGTTSFTRPDTANAQRTSRPAALRLCKGHTALVPARPYT